MLMRMRARNRPHGERNVTDRKLAGNAPGSTACYAGQMGPRLVWLQQRVALGIVISSVQAVQGAPGAMNACMQRRRRNDSVLQGAICRRARGTQTLWALEADQRPPEMPSRIASTRPTTSLRLINVNGLTGALQRPTLHRCSPNVPRPLESPFGQLGCCRDQRLASCWRWV